MTALNVTINSREYRVACDDGEEVHLRRVAADLDHRVRELARAMGPTNASDSLLVRSHVADALPTNWRMRPRLVEQVKWTAENGKKTEIDITLSETINEIAKRIERISGQLA